MDFTDAELTAITRACVLQAEHDRKLAEMTDRPAIRNQRLDSAAELAEIARQIEQDRRDRAIRGRGADKN
jgi:hypothetical protein